MNRTWRTTGRTGPFRSPVGAVEWSGLGARLGSWLGVNVSSSCFSEKEVNELLDELFDTVSFDGGRVVCRAQNLSRSVCWGLGL